MGPCIFCFRNSPEVTFTKEHLIPDSIGGKLILCDYVCTDCNNKFGAQFDHQILKNPDIFRAIEKLKLRHDRDQIIKHNYKVRGVLEDGVQVRARVTAEGPEFELVPRDLPDKSRIVPEAKYKKVLQTMCRRDSRGLTEAQIEEELRRLSDAYNKAEVGEKIEWPALDVTVIKRRYRPKFELEPKGSGDVSRLVAKISYEFGFIVGGRDFLLSERVAKPLNRFIQTGEKQPGVLHVTPISTRYSDFVPAHFIRFEANEYMTRVIIAFFGSIAHALIAPPFEHNVLQQLTERHACPNLIGVEYQQDLQRDTMSFWALLPENNIKVIRF